MEEKRIFEVYRERDRKMSGMPSYFGHEDISQFFRGQQRARSILSALSRRGIHDLSMLKILDVGCGNGNALRQFMQWGARPENLAGLELRPEPVEYARWFNPNLDLRVGSADSLPWEDASFDIVCQYTMFTSILNSDIKCKISREMLRVLKPDHIILWYDFWLNPTNPQTRGIRPAEIKALFPNCKYEFYKITLAPPIARRIVPFSWNLALFLEELKLFNSHYLALIRPTGS